MKCPSCTDEEMVDVLAPFGKGTYPYCRGCKRELAEINKAALDCVLTIPDSYKIDVEYMEPLKYRGYSLGGSGAGGYAPPIPRVAWVSDSQSQCTTFGAYHVHRYSAKLPSRFDFCECGTYMFRDLHNPP